MKQSGAYKMPDDNDSLSAVPPKRTGRLSNVLWLIISVLVRKGKLRVKKVTNTSKERKMCLKS
jgi:hypothetical protein